MNHYHTIFIGFLLMLSHITAYAQSPTNSESLHHVLLVSNLQLDVTENEYASNDHILIKTQKYTDDRANETHVGTESSAGYKPSGWDMDFKKKQVIMLYHWVL